MRVRVYLHDFASADAGMGVRACAVEDAGWDGLLLTDSQCLTADVFVALTLAAAATEHLEVGTCVTNAVTRHPSVVASAISAVQQASGGRALLGLSTGDSALLQVGLRPQRHDEFVADLERIHAYLHGEAVDQSGYSSRLSWLGDDQLPVPVQVFGSGPRMIAAASGVADRVTVAVGARREVVADRVKIARDARRRAGLDPDGLDLGAYVIVGVAEDPAAARDLVRGNVAIFAHFQRGDTVLSPEDSKVVGAVTEQWEERAHGVTTSRQTAVLTDDYIDHFAVLGDPATCAARLRELMALGLSHLVLIGASRDADPSALNANLDRIAGEVLPALRD
jgi:5,10-methylenetetrahydromethanopterin reductase